MRSRALGTMGPAISLMLAALLVSMQADRSAAALTVLDDVGYLERLRKSLTEADLVVVGTLKVTVNTRIRPRAMPGASEELRKRMEKAYPAGIWEPVRDGELAGALSVERILLGNVGKTQPLHIRFPRRTFVTPRRGALAPMMSGDHQLRADWLERGPHIWMLKKNGESYLTTAREPGFYIVPTVARRTVELLAAKATDAALREEALRQLAAESPGARVLGLRLLGGLRQQRDLALLPPHLFSNSYSVRESALHACRAMLAGADEAFFRQVAAGLNDAPTAEAAGQAVDLFKRNTSRELSYPKDGTEEEKLLVVRQLARWLKENAGALKWNKVTRRFEAAE